LLEELKTEANKGNIQEVITIADDVINNEQKINHHGKRAESIVKGLLQHSRKSTGTKELTDINALAHEYMRLSYHGLRAKDKSFNAVPIAIGIKMNLDPTMPLINVIPQDIGRVLLNLYNNAFWAVNEKNDEASNRKSGEVYEPLVTVSTKRVGDKFEIKVVDNGNGIPQKLVDKIFQPFFTTKPTGQGTGLGLSLAYDIIKAHGGELKVQSIEGEGATFIIQFPIVNKELTSEE
ncbi:MAG: ATP-binding protein, partial [Saprospiraceae bacterium]